MTRILLVAAAFGLAATSAQACEYQRSAKNKVDTTTVASIETPQSQPVMLPEPNAAPTPAPVPVPAK
jgi:hypothetical protein